VEDEDVAHDQDGVQQEQGLHVESGPGADFMKPFRRK
jgi:hypothetical protein